MRLTWILMALMMSSSCSTIYLKYKAKYVTENGKSGKYVLRKSYPVGSTRTWCFITGILYGGACWVYMGMPNSSHRKLIRKDAKANLKKYFQAGNIQITSESFKRISWDDRAEQQNIVASNGKAMPAAKSSAAPSAPATRSEPATSSSNENDEDGFLR